MLVEQMQYFSHCLLFINRTFLIADNEPSRFKPVTELLGACLD
jgi:hypothetical protein